MFSVFLGQNRGGTTAPPRNNLALRGGRGRRGGAVEQIENEGEEQGVGNGSNQQPLAVEGGIQHQQADIGQNRVENGGNVIEEVRYFK